MQNPRDGRVRVHGGARGEGLRNDDFQRVLFRVVRAPELAEPAPDATLAVVMQGPAPPAECVAPLPQDVVVRVAHVGAHLGYRQVPLDRRERGFHRVGRRPRDTVTTRPELEDGARDPLAQVRVVHGAAADAVALQDADRHVVGHAPAAVFVEERQHALFVLVEVPRRGVPPLLERNDRQPRARELSQHDRAARARPDDDGVRVDRDVARRSVAAAHDGSAHRGWLSSEARPRSGPSYPMTLHVRGSR